MAGDVKKPEFIRGRARKIAKGNIGLIGYVMQSNSPLLAVLKSNAARNRLKKTVNKDAGDYWINSWLPLRFSLYAEKNLGYKRSASKKRKSSKSIFSFRGKSFKSNDPLVNTGKTVGTALRTAASKGTPKGTNIRFKLARHLSKENTDVLTQVPAHEIAAIAKRMEETYTHLLNGELSTPPTERARRR